MAAARDQAARIIRRRAGNGRRRGRARRTAPLADQLRTHVAEEARRRPAEAPERAADRRAGRAAGSRRRAEIRQAQIRHDGRGRTAGARRRRLRRLLRSGRALLRLDRRRLCARQQHHARRAGRPAMSPRSCPRDNAIVRAGDVIFRIDDGDYRIAVDAARTKIATQQATIDRIGRQVTALESAVEQAKAQLASAEAGAEARRSRFRPPAGAEHQGLCLARHLRGVRSRPRPGRGRGEVGAGGL